MILCVLSLPTYPLLLHPFFSYPRRRSYCVFSLHLPSSFSSGGCVFHSSPSSLTSSSSSPSLWRLGLSFLSILTYLLLLLPVEAESLIPLNPHLPPPPPPYGGWVSHFFPSSLTSSSSSSSLLRLSLSFLSILTFLLILFLLEAETLIPLHPHLPTSPHPPLYGG